MEYCFNINTDKFKNIKKINNYNYNFLNNLYNYDININIYYDILNSYELFKLKNIFNYIYNRINKLNIENIKYISNIYKLDSEELNNILNEYIDSELKSIIIINSIQQYYKPSLI
tara:strand:+ start:208 stop:552 length:345 start_codon:yes stop_codon:yes gene_type:complete